jgi:hypothetical protein
VKAQTGNCSIQHGYACDPERTAPFHRFAQLENGETISPERGRELLATRAGGVASCYLGIVGAKFIPGPGWLIAGATASAGMVSRARWQPNTSRAAGASPVGNSET